MIQQKQIKPCMKTNTNIEGNPKMSEQTKVKQQRSLV